MEILFKLAGKEEVAGMDTLRQFLNSKPATVLMGVASGIFAARKTTGINWPPIIEYLWILFGGIVGAGLGLLLWRVEKELKEIFGKRNKE